MLDGEVRRKLRDTPLMLDERLRTARQLVNGFIDPLERRNKLLNSRLDIINTSQSSSTANYQSKNQTRRNPTTSDNNSVDSESQKDTDDSDNSEDEVEDTGEEEDSKDDNGDGEEPDTESESERRSSGYETPNMSQAKDIKSAKYG